MVTVPASVWRSASVGRALTTGGCVGVFFGALALLDSGIPLVAAIVFVILGASYGIWTARRMARYWPGARELTGAERVTVPDVRALRKAALVRVVALPQLPFGVPDAGAGRGLPHAEARNLGRSTASTHGRATVW